MKVTIIFLLVTLGSCKADNKKQAESVNQDSIIIKKDTTMERFDKAKFDANQIDGEYNFTLQNGRVVRQLKFGEDSYLEYSKYPGSTKEILKEFYSSTLFLKLNGELFYGFRIGKWNEYSEDGIPLKETDWDKPYKYSVNDLNLDMQKLGLDIMKDQGGIIISRNDDPAPQYIVTYPVNERPHELNVLLIDGNTGKIIQKSVRPIKN